MTDDRTPRSDSAAERYKELVAVATDAVDRLHHRERQRAAQLEEELATEHDRLERAEQQRQQVIDGVRLRWNAAMEALWEERWMRVTRIPQPEPSARPASPEEAIKSVQQAYLELYEEINKGRRSGTGWLPTKLVNRRKRGE